MRKTMLLTLLVALLLGIPGLWPAQAASPEEPKPVAVLSLAGYGELLGDIKLIGKIAGRPHLPERLEAVLKILTRDEGLAGLDKQRPLGAVVQFDGDRPTGYAFLPITDLDQLYQALRPYILEATDFGDGVYEVEGTHGEGPLYVKEKDGGWLFVSDKVETLDATPADPCQLLAGLNEQYDLAVRLNVCNVSEELRRKVVAKLETGAQRRLQRKAGEGDEEYAVRKIVTQNLLGVVIGAANELEHITLGWSLDHDVEKALLELSATAIEDTGAAEELAKLGQTRTNFGGFRQAGAVLTGNWAGECCGGGTDDLAAVFGAIRAKASQEIDSKQGSQQWDEVAKNLIGGLLEVAQETLASGRADGGLAILLNPEGATVLLGKYVADSNKLENTLGQLVDAVRQEHPDFVERVLTPDADQYKGVRFHVVSIRVPDFVPDRDKVVQLIGENLTIVVGIGDESVYLAAGKDALKALKQAIERSETASFQTVPPVEFSVALGELANFVAEMGRDHERPKAQKALAVLQQAPGNDHVRLVALPIERGVKYRLELEEGVLKLLAAIGKAR